MAAFNKAFELDIDDLELIETALREKQSQLSAKSAACDMAKRMNELLGRLHNQKNFYRPKKGVYVGG